MTWKHIFDMISLEAYLLKSFFRIYCLKLTDLNDEKGFFIFA